MTDPINTPVIREAIARIWAPEKFAAFDKAGIAFGRWVEGSPIERGIRETLAKVDQTIAILALTALDRPQTDGGEDDLCDDCPPIGYPTDKTRCLPCPRRTTSHVADADKLLDDLQQAESEYRLMHDRHGDGSMAAGRSWDLMRRAGDKARSALNATPQTDGEAQTGAESEHEHDDDCGCMLCRADAIVDAGMTQPALELAREALEKIKVEADTPRKFWSGRELKTTLEVGVILLLYLAIGVPIILALDAAVRWILT